MLFVVTCTEKSNNDCPAQDRVEQFKALIDNQGLGERKYAEGQNSIELDEGTLWYYTPPAFEDYIGRDTFMGRATTNDYLFLFKRTASDDGWEIDIPADPANLPNSGYARFQKFFGIVFAELKAPGQAILSVSWRVVLVPEWEDDSEFSPNGGHGC